MTSGQPSEDSAPRVLIAEDSATIRKHLQRTLEAAGFDVKAAASGEEALALTLEQTFDVVVSDIEMGAVTGVQLCRILRSDPGTADMPIVLVTAAGDARTRFWGRHAGADAYLRKADIQASLVDTVQQLVAGRRRHKARPQFTGAPLDRLSRVLDEHLFEAVVTNEVRRLMDHIHDRAEFAEHLLLLCAEVVDTPYITLELHGPGGPSLAVLVRGPWTDDDEGIRALGLADVAYTGRRFVHVESIEGECKPGESSAHTIRARSDTLGRLQLYSGRQHLGTQDTRTAEQICQSSGEMVTSLFLMEETRLLALTDGLTGLYNRRYAEGRLEEEIARVARHGSGLCVAMCDIDHFKKVNDQYGHGAGDDVLRVIASTLQQFVRRSDVVCRWGGEEFLMILPDTQGPAARVVIERLRQHVEKTALKPGGPDHVTASFGVSAWEAKLDAAALVGRADAALYRAKDRGRNRVETA